MNALGVAADGDVYVAGEASASVDGEPFIGLWDAYLRKLAPDGSVRWARQWGTAQGDRANALRVASSGEVYVTGSVYGALDGKPNTGFVDAFLVRYLPDGTRQ